MFPNDQQCWHFSLFISQSYDIFFKEWFGKMKGELLHGQTEITYMKLFQWLKKGHNPKDYLSQAENVNLKAKRSGAN